MTITVCVVNYTIYVMENKESEKGIPGASGIPVWAAQLNIQWAANGNWYLLISKSVS